MTLTPAVRPVGFRVSHRFPTIQITLTERISFMRARSHRPTFDPLDVRLVLDNSMASMVSVGVMATPGLVANLTSPPDISGDIPGVTDWFLPGMPPAPTPPSDPVLWLLMTTN